jgi:hypothetical protein
MNRPQHDFICPVCGLAVPLWRGKECAFHQYFHDNRKKDKTYKEIAEAFFKEHPDMNRRANEERNH